MNQSVITNGLPKRCSRVSAKNLPNGAISTRSQKPASDIKVIAYVDDASVAIHGLPCIAWISGDVWWTGLPQSYVNLRDARWTVTHWLPLPEERPS